MNPLLDHQPRHLLVMKKVKPANPSAADSPLQPPPLPPLGRRHVNRHQVVNVRWQVPFGTNGTSNVYVVLEIYVKPPAEFNQSTSLELGGILSSGVD